MNKELAELLRKFLMEEPGIFFDSFNQNKKALAELMEIIMSMEIKYAELCEVNSSLPFFSVYVEGPELEEGSYIRVALYKEEETTIKA